MRHCLVLDLMLFFLYLIFLSFVFVFVIVIVIVIVTLSHALNVYGTTHEFVSILDLNWILFLFAS
jgi:hypothetical protein